MINLEGSNPGESVFMGTGTKGTGVGAGIPGGEASSVMAIVGEGRSTMPWRGWIAGFGRGRFSPLSAQFVQCHVAPGRDFGGGIGGTSR